MPEYHEILKRRNDDPQSALWIRSQPALLLQNHLWAENAYRPEVQVRLFYTDEILYTNFRVFEENPTVTCYERNSPVYKDSCVEFFLQPAPSSDNRYLNFEWNAAGTLLLGLGSGRHDRTMVTEMDTDMFGIETASGLSEENTNRLYWELTFRVPFSFISGWFANFHPVPGSAMRGNFYKCGDDTPFPHHLSWNPVTAEKPDFHRSVDFGELVFG